MKEISSEDLLTLISIDPDDPECREAYDEFYKRFKEFVWNISYKVARNIDKHNALSLAMIVMNNAFYEVFINAGVFVQPSDTHQDDKIRVWLSGIVKNMVRRYLYENNKHKNHIVFMEVLPELVEPEINRSSENPVLTYERKTIEYALKSLDEKHRTVLLAWYNFSDGYKIHNIDKEVKENLAKQFNVKVDSMKKIKQRALEQVKSFIEKTESNTRTYVQSK